MTLLAPHLTVASSDPRINRHHDFNLLSSTHFRTLQRNWETNTLLNFSNIRTKDNGLSVGHVIDSSSGQKSECNKKGKEILYHGGSTRQSRCGMRIENGDPVRAQNRSNWSHFRCKDHIVMRSIKEMWRARTRVEGNERVALEASIWKELKDLGDRKVYKEAD